MLTKLLHYEFRATGRIVLPIAAGVLVLNVLAAVLAILFRIPPTPCRLSALRWCC